MYSVPSPDAALNRTGPGEPSLGGRRRGPPFRLTVRRHPAMTLWNTPRLSEPAA